jgi:hypothetical protein
MSTTTVDTFDPKEGNTVSWRNKSAENTGVVIKRNGVRLRIASPDGSQHWVEIKDVISVLAESSTVLVDDLVGVVPDTQGVHHVSEPNQERHPLPTPPQEHTPAKVQQESETGSASKEIKQAFFKMMLNDGEEDNNKPTKVTEKEAPGMAEFFATFSAGAAAEAPETKEPESQSGGEEESEAALAALMSATPSAADISCDDVLDEPEASLGDLEALMAADEEPQEADGGEDALAELMGNYQDSGNGVCE